jgi:hypothetical protein
MHGNDSIWNLFIIRPFGSAMLSVSITATMNDLTSLERPYFALLLAVALVVMVRLVGVTNVQTRM